MAVRDSSPPPTAGDTALTGATGRRAWFGLEERHRGMMVLRAGLIGVVAVVVALAPADLSSAERIAALVICLAALVAHGVLHLASDRRPRLLRASVDASLVVDAAWVFGLAVLSGHLDSAALWLIPVLCVATALGLSGLTGFKSLVLLAVATGAVGVVGPADQPLTAAAGPLVVAAAVVIVAAAMATVNEKELRRRGERVDALHDASQAFVSAQSPEELADIARYAAGRLLPGWSVQVALDAPLRERSTWREGWRLHLAIPIVSPPHQGFEVDGTEQQHGMLLADRPAPRRGRAATLRGRQLRALDTLCAGLAGALAQVNLMLRLERLSLVDPLTGLGNRRAFDRALDVELVRSARSGEAVGLLIVDVDHFKRFNDTHGHMAGDRALAAVGDCLGRIGRREDAACRIGGEEFALLLPGAGGPAALLVGERVRRAVAGIELREGRLTVSVGVASTRAGGDAGALVALADSRLYEAKNAGRDRVVGDPHVAAGPAANP
jgi:diguanylate cyclase (GGDEF)-like protein